MEFITKCVPYRVTLQCDKCKKGFMNATGRGMQLPVYPPINKFEHKCSECGKKEMLDRSYPFITYEPIEEPHPKENTSEKEDKSDPTPENTIE